MHQRYRRIIASALALSSFSLFIPTVAQAGYSDYESFHLVRTDNSPSGGAQKICTYQSMVTRKYVQLEMPNTCPGMMFRNLNDGQFYDRTS
ncbi:hypothetical protein [Phytobacter diazotrophicus]|uniref:hypothetical protein n=1 Tax=Enterobacteriaceae TaxID=543 RepID=UPI002FEE67BA